MNPLKRRSFFGGLIASIAGLFGAKAANAFVIDRKLAGAFIDRARAEGGLFKRLEWQPKQAPTDFYGLLRQFLVGVQTATDVKEIRGQDIDGHAKRVKDYALNAAPISNDFCGLGGPRSESDLEAFRGWILEAFGLDPRVYKLVYFTMHIAAVPVHPAIELTLDMTLPGTDRVTRVYKDYHFDPSA